jgi:hypothetical protein
MFGRLGYVIFIFSTTSRSTESHIQPLIHRMLGVPSEGIRCLEPKLGANLHVIPRLKIYGAIFSYPLRLQVVLRN